MKIDWDQTEIKDKEDYFYKETQKDISQRNKTFSPNPTCKPEVYTPIIRKPQQLSLHWKRIKPEHQMLFDQQNSTVSYQSRISFLWISHSVHTKYAGDQKFFLGMNFTSTW